MSQHDMDIANAAGAAIRADLNLALAALVSNSSGATEPATKFAYQFWADTTTGLLKIRNAANSAWVTIGTLATVNLGLAAVAGSASQTFSMAAATAVTHGVRADQIQLSSLLSFTTAGTSAAFTLAPAPALAALTTNHRFNVKFNVAPTGTPTLAISGLTAKLLKYRDGAGTKQPLTATQAPAGWISDVFYDGVDYIVEDLAQVAFATSSTNATTSTTQVVGNSSTAIATTQFCEEGFVNNSVGTIGVGCFAYGRHINSTWNADTDQAAANIYLLCFINGAANIYTPTAGTWRNISQLNLTVHAIGILQRVA